MLYAAMTVWLLIIVAMASGVQRIWQQVTNRPKVLNVALLPGTLIAQLGHVLGLLITGATVSDTRLINDDETGEPATTTNPEPKIPVIGPILIGMLPMVACAAAIFFVTRFLGESIESRLAEPVVGPALPTTLAGFWEMLRDMISLVESFVNAVREAVQRNPSNWRIWLFLYLLACLTIRMAPLPGNLKGSIGAIVVLGLAGAAIASLFDVPDPRLAPGWAVMNLAFAALLLLLMVSLIVQGAVTLVRHLRGSH